MKAGIRINNMQSSLFKIFFFCLAIVLPGEESAAVETGGKVEGIHFLEAWSAAGAQKVKAPNPGSDLVSFQDYEHLTGEMPVKCLAHITKETEELKTVEYDAHRWMAHVAECMCCGPVLAGIFATHVNNVANLPHSVVFFDFDSAKITPDNREQLRQFIAEHHNRHRRFLLIGRASRTISVDHPLDYLRDHSLYNLKLSEKRAVAVRDFISSRLFKREPEPGLLYDLLPIRVFGLADPQINPSYVHNYNIEERQWRSRSFKGDDPDGYYRLNQSVVVIAFDGRLRKDLGSGAASFEQVSLPYREAH